MYNFGLTMTQLSNNTFKGVNEKPKVSPWKLKNPNINIQDLNPTLYSYLESLPAELQSSIVITAGKEDGHSVTGGHGKGNAVDIRLNKSEGWDQKFMDYLYNDSEKRKNLGIAFLDPNHGTAPHIHLSIGVQHEIENDFYYGKKAVKPFQFKSGETKPEEVEALPAYTPIEMPKEYSNEALISSFNKAMEMANNIIEKEKENEAANYLIQRELERKQKLELVNSLSLSYETFMEDGGTIEFANGGPIKPLYVKDPGDPRLRAYNDSLALLNAPFESYKVTQFLKKSLVNAKSGEDTQQYFKEYKKRFAKMPSNKAYKRLTSINGEPPTPIKGSEFGWGLEPSDPASPRYKKPVQPVILEKNEEPKVFTETPTPLNPNYTAPDPTTGFPFIDATPVPVNTPNSTTKTNPTGPVIWYTLAGDNKIHVGGVNKYMTFEEFDKYMDENPNNQYSAKANSVGYVYQRGKGAVKLN